MPRRKRHQLRDDGDSCSDADSESTEDEKKSEPAVKETSVINNFIDNSFSTRAAAQLTALRLRDVTIEAKGNKNRESTRKVKAEEHVKKGSKSEYMRLDNLWSKREFRFVMSPTTKDQTTGQYDGYAFNVVRHFTYSNRYESTELHILSKPLKKAMHHVMGESSIISANPARSIGSTKGVEGGLQQTSMHGVTVLILSSTQAK